MGILYQVLTVFILSYMCATVGIMFTWPSSTILLFSSANTTLHRPMTDGEISLLGSLSSIGAVVSIPTIGFLLDSIGRKKCILLACCAAVLGWGMIAACTRVEVVLTAVFVFGFCSTSLTTCTVYIGDFCQESIRGPMAAAIMLFYSIGILISYAMGGAMEYWPMVYTNLGLVVIAFIGLMFLKESPLYLLRKGKEKEATQSLAFYRQESVDSVIVHDEMNYMRRVLNPELDDEPVQVLGREKLYPEMMERKPRDEKLSLLQFLKKSQSSRRAIAMSLILSTAATFQGLPVLEVYAEPLFTQAVPTVPANICTLILGAVVVLSGILSAYLIEAAGRKRLMIHGSILSGISCILLGTQIHLAWGPNWLTAVFIYIFCVCYTIGAGTVPFVIIVEVFLPEVKSFANMLTLEWIWICNTLNLTIFTPLVKAMGLGPIFYIFSAICFLTAVFSTFFVPETKGLPVDVIQLFFMDKRRRQSRLSSSKVPALK